MEAVGCQLTEGRGLVSFIYTSLDPRRALSDSRYDDTSTCFLVRSSSIFSVFTQSSPSSAGSTQDIADRVRSKVREGILPTQLHLPGNPNKMSLYL